MTIQNSGYAVMRISSDDDEERRDALHEPHDRRAAATRRLEVRFGEIGGGERGHERVLSLRAERKMKTVTMRHMIVSSSAIVEP